jgi:DNA-binding CsgD family transcriptional regulator
VTEPTKRFFWERMTEVASTALRETIRVSIPLIERLDNERSIATARTHQGEKDFAAAWEAGRAMTPEQAITSQGNAIIAPLAAPAPASSTMYPAASTYPAGLTAREVEVLRLVARGLTSGVIALELKISAKTVAHHLTHIFNKTSSENRAAAVAFAIRHGLAWAHYRYFFA